MPFEKQTLKKFFLRWDQQRADRFLVTIFPKDTSESRFEQQLQDLGAEGATATFCPKIEQYQVQNITIPNFEFKKEHQPNGVLIKSYPVLDFTGFTFPILFTEDRFGTIERFIHWCQKRIIHSSGQYYHPDVSRIGDIWVEIINWKNEPIVRYVLQGAYFLSQTPITLDYTNSVAMPISITFGADYLSLETEFEQELGENTPTGTA
jgi:hypothetical protein